MYPNKIPLQQNLGVLKLIIFFLAEQVTYFFLRHFYSKKKTHKIYNTIYHPNTLSFPVFSSYLFQWSQIHNTHFMYITTTETYNFVLWAKHGVGS